jgi:hypothetical protein
MARGPLSSVFLLSQVLTFPLFKLQPPPSPSSWSSLLPLSSYSQSPPINFDPDPTNKPPPYQSPSTQLLQPLLLSGTFVLPSFPRRPFLNCGPFPSFVSSSQLIPNACSHTPTNIHITLQPPFSPVRGSRNGRNNQSPCPFFYARYLLNWTVTGLLYRQSNKVP